MKNFTNFHNHTVYSLLDGFTRIDRYCARAKELGQKAVTITDHGNMFGALDFYEVAEEHGLKAFLGEEFYQARKTRFDRDGEERAAGSSTEWGQRGPYHCGIIAYNNVGYHNLVKLSSKAFLEGYFVKPRIDHQLLEEHNKGLVMLSGCLSGEVQQALLRDDYQFALDTAAKMQAIFGKENYFIEVQNHGIEEEKKNYPLLLQIAKEIGAPIIATCDSHYVHKNDAHFHDVMLCVNTGSRLEDEGRFKFSGDEFYLKSYDEMTMLFPQEYIDNTMLIYEKHDLKLNFDEYHFPQFPLPPGRMVDEYFKEKVWTGARFRFGDLYQNNKVVMDRLNYEIDVIIQMGFANYFLVVADIVTWAKDQGILVGFGRGSAAGSLTSFVMRITEVDPLEYGLPFERFLVPGRKTMPDIDLDFDDRYRERVIEYTRNKYGADHTAQICTYSTMGAKKAVRDAARVMGYDFDIGDKISKAMPPPVFGKAKDLAECMRSAEFLKLYETDPDVKAVVDTAMGLEGLIRETGVHPAGFIIADRPIMDYVPVMQYGEDKPIVTQYNMYRMENNGLLKIDFLALRNLAIVDMCLENIKKRRDIDLDFLDIPKMHDQKVYDSLSRGQNVGIFQAESDGVKELLVGVKPTSIHELSDIIALYRPGPMGSNVHNEYIERKHKRKPVKHIHPSTKVHLGDTYGLLLYQEQLLKLATDVAGFSIGHADGLRKAVGKKIPIEMKKYRDDWIQGCIKSVGMSRDLATKLFNEIEHHADYSFGKNHSISYALLMYITAFLRENYPVEYMAAALSTVQDDEDRLRLYLQGAKSMGLSVLPPSINYSDVNFAVKSDTEIAYAFSAISGIGEVKASKTVASRSEPYVSLFDFMRRIDGDLLNKKIIEHFTAAGCFDELIPDVNQPKLTRHEKILILQQETEELGVFLSDHPLTDVYDLISNKVSHNINELGNLATTTIKVAGVIIEVKKKMTKAGKKMYNLKIEDLTGVIRVDIFPAKAELIPDGSLREGDIIIVTGKVDKKSDDEDSVISLKYFEHEKVDTEGLSGGKPIVLQFPSKPHYEQIKKINDIIEYNEGDSAVLLSFIDQGKLIKMAFNKTTSLEVEDLLKTLVEVSI